MNKTILVLILPIFLFAQTLLPHREFKANGMIYEFLISDNKIYSATDKGEIDIFSLESAKLVETIKFPTIPNFYGENIPAKLYSIDKFKNKILILSESEYGGRTIYLSENGKIRKILNSRSPIKKVRFINDVLFMYATLGNEIVLYDLWNNKQIYKKQINSSPFSDFSIYNDEVAIACESGEISIANIWTGDILDILKGGNLDNVYKLVFQNNIIVGAGQDRQVGIYQRKTGKYSQVKAEFIIYSVGLSADGKIGAYPYNQNNEIKIFETKSGNILHILKGQKATLNTMKFIDKQTLLTSSDDEYILEWKLLP